MAKIIGGIAFLALAFLFAIGAVYYMVKRPMADTSCRDRVVFEDKNAAFCIEIADSIAKWMQGLAGRNELAPDFGMLFVFSDLEPNPTFTMKGMQFPLDIIFLDAESKVAYVAHNLPACPTKNACATVTSPVAARYVLEVNAGEAEKYGIVAGFSAIISESP